MLKTGLNFLISIPVSTTELRKGETVRANFFRYHGAIEQTITASGSVPMRQNILKNLCRRLACLVQAFSYTDAQAGATEQRCNLRYYFPMRVDR